MTPWLDDGDVRLYHGDCLEVLRQLPSSSVHMCATSPPFYGLRDYGTGSWEGGNPECDHQRQSAVSRSSSGLDGATHTQGGTYAWGAECGKCGATRVDQQIGLEETPDQWVERLVAVFREVRRVLRDDGTLWVEIGDSYGAKNGRTDADRIGASLGSDDPVTTFASKYAGDELRTITPLKNTGTKPKDLLGQPWLLAFALRADGWYLRSEIIWARPNPMPESVTDRPTKSHSTVFLLSKQPRYFYDADAIREPLANGSPVWGEAKSNQPGWSGNPRVMGEKGHALPANPAGANARSVWTIPTEPTPFAHFATWPQALVRRMVLAGTSEKGCCPECGAPWVRKIERTSFNQNSISTKRQLDGAMRQDGDRNLGGQQFNKFKRENPDRLLGWRPSCQCQVRGEVLRGKATPQKDSAESLTYLAPIPATVLDPFAGSGTTLLVARKLGRHSVGIELNEDYCKLAADRTSQQSLLTGSAT